MSAMSPSNVPTMMTTPTFDLPAPVASSGQAVENELGVFDVECVDVREARFVRVPAHSLGSDDGAGACAAVLHADRKAVQRAERVEQALHLTGRNGEQLLGALVDHEHGSVVSGKF